MKADLTDITFLILIRLDSIERLENLLTVTDSLLRYFNTNIYVLEADHYNNGVLKRLLSRKIRYQFVEDKDPVLYKTRYFNRMTSNIETPFMAIWDADIAIDKENIEQSLMLLRNKKADIVYPYNGKCFDVSPILRTFYLKKKTIRSLHKHKNKMELLHDRLLVGGAVLMDKEKFVYAGMENEKHYGWGNDDFDRYYRFIALGYKVHRINTCLFHLWHPRGINSSYRMSFSEKMTRGELLKTENSSKEEILMYMSNNNSVI